MGVVLSTLTWSIALVATSASPAKSQELRASEGSRCGLRPCAHAVPQGISYSMRLLEIQRNSFQHAAVVLVLMLCSALCAFRGPAVSASCRMHSSLLQGRFSMDGQWFDRFCIDQQNSVDSSVNVMVCRQMLVLCGVEIDCGASGSCSHSRHCQTSSLLIGHSCEPL